jgi:chromosomal replication initiator protein
MQKIQELNQETQEDNKYLILNQEKPFLSYSRLETDNIWARTLEIISSKIKKPSYETWIRPLKLIAIENDTALIGVKNDFTRNFIFQSYHCYIEPALKEASAHSLAIRYVLDNSAEIQIPNNTSEPEQVKLSHLSPQKPKLQSAQKSQLNQHFSFANFVENNSNKACLTFAKAIIENHSGIYNSLFIVSESGLGKTHILHAIGNYALNEEPGTRIKFVNAEEFTNQLITSITKNKTQEFRNSYRNIDILLFDDFHFLDNKKACQEEFIYTFEAICSKGGKVVIASGKQLHEFKSLNKKLESRLKGALVSPINKPSYSARVKILSAKALQNNIQLNNKYLNTIAEKFQTNIRELEGALMQISALQNYMDTAIDDEIISNLFGGLASFPANRGASIDSICKQVAEFFGIEPEDITGKKRVQEFTRARHVAIYLSYKLLNISYARIGESFAGRKHSSVIHSIKTIDSILQSNLPSAKSVKKLVENVLLSYS